MKKINIKNIVQGPVESGDEFSTYLEKEINKIIQENNLTDEFLPKLLVSASQTGRQTVLIYYYTENKTILNS